MHYFLFLGLVELLILSYKDIKTLRIDSRFNWFMYGVSASLIANEKPGLIYLFSLMIAVALIGALLSRFIPSGDVECLGWCMFGYASLGLACSFSCLSFSHSCIHSISAQKILQNKRKDRVSRCSTLFICIHYDNNSYTDICIEKFKYI